MKKIYLMRHGETRLNVLGLNQGSWDSPLTELGIEQAKKAKQWFMDENIIFNFAFSSTKERASDTLEIITNLKDGEYSRDKRLSEWDFGLYEGQNAKLNPAPLNPDKGTKSYGKAYVPYGGEADTEVSKRMEEAMNDIAATSSEVSLVVSHGGSIYLWLQRHIDQKIIQKAIPFGNCSIFELIYDNNTFELARIIDPNR